MRSGTRGGGIFCSTPVLFECTFVSLSPQKSALNVNYSKMSTCLIGFPKCSSRPSHPPRMIVYPFLLLNMYKTIMGSHVVVLFIFCVHRYVYV